ncbi:MAG: methionine synthase [Candidatus Lernaella stagnicola]|nr:methionine synthase [Candidatus Lernaella stagnicola]
MNLLDIAKTRILLLDGAMGTQIQNLNLPLETYDGREGCPEVLNLTVPDKIHEIHRAYLAAGADIVETNTFGGVAQVLAEYGLDDRVEHINETAAKLARAAADEFTTTEKPRFVTGSIGPGTKLASLGQITFEELYAGHRRQIEGLIAGGVDMLNIETVQDPLQAKAALAAAFDVMAHSREVPVYVSVTVEQTGTLLTGTDIQAAIAIFEPFAVDVLGLNCATGPVAMRPYLEELARHWPRRIGLYPNAGLPVPCATGVCYPETPEGMADVLARYLDELPIHFIGGCCGTTPEHIARFAEIIAGRTPRERQAEFAPSVASLFGAVTIHQDPPPLFIGERANATGSKAFREAILAGDHDTAFDILVEQVEHGSHCADLSVAYAGQDELHHMESLVRRAAKECQLPLFIDTNLAESAELALKRYPGRAVINSINLEDGGKRADIVGPLAKRFGAGLICLTIDEEGMAMTADRKVAIAKRLVELCETKYGLRRQDLLIDALTFTVGSGDATLKDAAAQTLAAIARIKKEIPGVSTLLGLSNVSFGLSMKSRRVLNSVFLDRCLAAGLDAAILNPKHIVPLAQLDETDVARALDVIYNRPVEGVDPLEAFIHHFAGRPDEDDPEAEAALAPEEAVREAVVRGKTKLALSNLPLLLRERSAEDILNGVLVPAMKHVGELFGAGKMQLPFVLKSAETMKKAVDFIKPHFRGTGAAGPMKKLVIATVRGDVHDIGKNLVDIIVSNNGFDVRNLGIKVPVQEIIHAVQEERPAALGMSGLLVTSAMIMAENLRAMTDAGLDVPVLVGGAALTPEFVRDTLKPAYGSGTVTYCPDAFAGLEAMQDIAAGRAPSEPERNIASELPPDSFRPRMIDIDGLDAPTPPFYGSRVVRGVKLEPVLSYVNKIALYRGRWGYRRGELPKDEFDRLMREDVRPRYRELVRVVKAEKLFDPQIVYGWYPARGEGSDVIVQHEGRQWRFNFPRRRFEPEVGIGDFVKPDGDVVGFFVVTLGDGAVTRGREIFEKDAYLDYYLLHGLAVETTDALAEYAHAMMRHEIGIGEDRRLNWQELVTLAYRGSRYGFGYPACPDLAAHELVWDMLDPERIGVTLGEGYQMVPEYSTAAIVIHHPQAKYFAV